LNRLEYLAYRPTPRQLVALECEKFFQARHERIARVLIAERDHLLPSEKATLSMFDIELLTLQNIVIDELAAFDFTLTLREAEQAKHKG
jgi:hypothetical protein